MDGIAFENCKTLHISLFVFKGIFPLQWSLNHCLRPGPAVDIHTILDAGLTTIHNSRCWLCSHGWAMIQILLPLWARQILIFIRTLVHRRTSDKGCDWKSCRASREGVRSINRRNTKSSAPSTFSRKPAIAPFLRVIGERGGYHWTDWAGATDVISQRHLQTFEEINSLKSGKSTRCFADLEVDADYPQKIQESRKQEELLHHIKKINGCPFGD